MWEGGPEAGGSVGDACGSGFFAWRSLTFVTSLPLPLDEGMMIRETGGHPSFDPLLFLSLFLKGLSRTENGSAVKKGVGIGRRVFVKRFRIHAVAFAKIFITTVRSCVREKVTIRLLCRLLRKVTFIWNWGKLHFL